MNAIELLESQHRDIERLFARIEMATRSDAKEKLFKAIADKLAIHAAIEEQRFYPALKGQRTEDLLCEALEEHLRIERVLGNLLETEASDESFDAKIKILKEQVEHHVGELERDLFPQVKELLAEDELEALGNAMSVDQGKPGGQGQGAKGHSIGDIPRATFNTCEASGTDLLHETKSGPLIFSATSLPPRPSGRRSGGD